ncbi:rho guanine nucleotide exchange factor 7-like [Brevipalpus obovatus]|uniref:rho guanine nucleotide exchange factor 7-like n=1 Tax=Brevipalpus obovatus TaxID=246614 RepID=UPI003D9F3AAE
MDPPESSLTASLDAEEIAENDTSDEQQNKNCLRIVKAIYSFNGANNDELCFEKDDLIILTQTPEGGWYEGTHLSKRVTGWFPAGYVSPLSTEQAHSLLDQHFIDSFSRDNNQQNSRMMVFKEVLNNESNSLSSMQTILQTYLLILQKSQIIPKEEVEAVVNSYREVISTHTEFLNALEALEFEPGCTARIGGIFMSNAPAIKRAHLNYCSMYPKFISLILNNREKVRELLKETLLSSPDSCDNQLLSLMAGLSLTFRHLDKYPSFLQELQRYTNDAHPDRGDVQRSGFVYRELVTCCLQMRRQKEMELEVLLGNVLNWPASHEPLQSLGPVVHMGSITVLQTPKSHDVKKDRHLVLFPAHLVLLSVSDEMTSFVFDDQLSLVNVTLPRLPEIQSTKTTFQLLIADPGSDATGKYVFSCLNPEDVLQWISSMHQCKSKLETNKSTESSIREVRSSPAHSQPTESPVTSSSDRLRNEYWSTRSIIPHPPLRNSTSNLENELSSSIKNLDLGSSKKVPVNDMAILKVIETYCHGSRNRGEGMPQVMLADEERIIVAKNTDAEDPNFEEKSLVETVYELQEEVKQIKTDISYLSQCSAKQRHMMKNIVGLISKSLGSDTSAALAKLVKHSEKH